MADELLDIVNNEGEVVGSTMKSIAHKKGLLHQTVIAEVIDKDRTWTLVKQSESKQDTGQYVSAIGGHVISGESVIHALKREAREEYGLSGNFEFKLIGKKPILDKESVSYKRFAEKDLATELKIHPEKFGPPFLFLINTFYPKLTL